MPAPSSSVATLRPDLGGTMQEFDLAMDRAGFIGHRVLPVFEAAKASGEFGKIPIEQLLQSPETRRAPGSRYNRGSWTFLPASYACEEHGWEEPVDDREANLYAEYFDAEQVSADRARDFVLRNAELRAAALVFNPTTWASYTSAVATPWSTAASATPIADVNTAKQNVWNQCGMWPNALIINREAFNHVRATDDVKDNIASSGAGESVKASKITEQQLAEVFDLNQVIVAGSAKNTANTGQAASLAQIWSSTYAMVARVAETNDIREPCIGRTFHWGEDGSEIGGLIETYRDETVRGDVMRSRHDVDEVVIYVEAAYLLSNIAP